MQIRSLVLSALVLLLSPMAHCSTLTFDEFPSGTILSDSAYSGVSFSQAWRATDHTGYTWGPPHSGANVLSCVHIPYGDTPTIVFGHVLSTGLDVYPVQSVGAYFSTAVGASVRITAYHWSSGSPEEVSNIVIGTAGESWNNRYIEISSPASPFEMLIFEAVNSPSDIETFSLDDMTITPVPEPSSLAALTLALLSATGAAVARRRRA